LDSIKDPAFSTLLSMASQPWAKIFSITTTGAVVTLYNRHAPQYFNHKDKRRRCTLFYGINTIYSVLFVVVGLLLSWTITESDVPKESHDGSETIPRAILGYVTYVLIESYGSLLVCIFWSFTNDEVSLESAKSSYGYIVAVGQIGAICGSGAVEIWEKNGRR